MKIRDQLIIFFSITIILSVGITSFLALSYTELGIIDAEIAKMKTQNEEIMHDIETLHSRASEDLVFTLKNPKFVEYFELPESKAGNIYDKNGVLQFTEKQSELKKELERWTYHFQNKFDIDETCLIDNSGQEHTRLVLTKIAPDEDLSPEEKSASFFEPSFMKQRDEVHVQYPYVSPDTERWVFAYTSPIQLDNGQKPAIYHFEMPMTVFQNMLKVDSGRAYVVDPAGFIVADSAGTVPNDVISFEPKNQFPPVQTVYASNNNEILDEMFSKQIGEGVYEVDGEEHYFVFERLSTFDWVLVYEKPESLILIGNSSVSELENTIMLISAVIIGFGVLSIVIISSRISKPIHKLAEEISSENPERLEVLQSPNHEVSKITNSVNELMNKMSKYQEEIHCQNQELIIQKQQLERLARIGELASRLTHNLRTPLTVIKATADLLIHSANYSLDKASIEKLDRIKSASENLEKQIEEVLTYVKNKPMDLKNISFKKLIDDTLQNIDVPENIEIILSENDQNINCDSDKMQVVFMNIISNAVEALDKNGKIYIESASTNNENVIEIRDDGPGISSENVGKIFDSLFTTKSSGTGLGLPYCKSVIEQHGGSISVSTNPTTFTIILPKKSISKKIE
jgi:signal transduction histidine kinase